MEFVYQHIHSGRRRVVDDAWIQTVLLVRHHLGARAEPMTIVLEFDPRDLYVDDPDDIRPDKEIERRASSWGLQLMEREIVNHPKAVALLDDAWSSWLSPAIGLTIAHSSDFQWDCPLGGRSVVEEAIAAHGTLLLFGGPYAGDDIEAAAADQALYGGRLPPAKWRY